MAVCGACGAGNPESARFCNECAAPLQTASGSREQRKTVTVLFCDVVGSTALGESRDPEALRDVLARYFERMKAIVERHGGSVEKFIGDAVMAVFGVPAVHEDDALRALRAAAEMRAALPQLGVEARFGIDSGEVVTGTKERLATGDAVNVAARLQQAAAPGEILLGALTRALARDAVEVEELAPLVLKGKTAPVAAYRLVGVREAPERRHEARFVGRSQELALLREAWERAMESRRCELVTIVGEPGVGKSRLVAELVAGLQVPVVGGRCLSYGEGISYWPVIEVIKQLRVVPADEAAAAALGSLLGEGDAATSPDEIAWAFRKLLEQEAPLLVIFDDIQWGEETFLDLVEQVALLLGGTPLLLLCVARPELSTRRPGWPVSLRLSPLAGEEVEELLPATVPPGLRERIARAAGGNPLFLTEMVAMAADAAGEILVPATLKAVLASRLDQLETSERRVLECGAVEGELFHRGAVQALEATESQVAPQLMALVRKELIRPDRPVLPAEDGFRFCHLLIRDAAYDALPKTTRAELHERFAGWLDQRGTSLVERDELVGYHLQQSFRYRTELGLADDATRTLGERAAARLVAAGRRATTRGDLHAAANLFERAIPLGISDPRERVRVQVELGYALGETGRGSEGEAVLSEAHDAATSVGTRGLAAYALLYGLRFRLADPEVDLEEVRAICDQAIETFGDLGDERGLALAGRQLVMTMSRRGGQSGVAELEDALVHALASGDPIVRRQVMGSLANSLIGGPTPVIEAIGRCEELLESSRDDRVLEAVLKRKLGRLYAMAARCEEALELVRQSSLVLDELNQLTASSIYRRDAAYAKELAGDDAGAEQELTARWEALRRSGSRGIDRPTINASHDLATFYCDRGRWDDAERLLAFGSDVPATYRKTTTWRLAVEARLAAHHGRYEEALGLAQRAVEREGQTDHLDWRAGIWLALAEVQRAAGATAEADAAVATALSLYERKGNIAAAMRLRAAATNPSR